MSGTFSSDINLNLALMPDEAVRPDVALAIAPVHYAVHSLHRGVSQVTGTWRPSSLEWPTIPPQMTLLVANHRKFYAVAAAAINAGQLVYITAAGQMALASAAAVGTLAQGWATQNVVLGATGEFILFEGLLAVTGAVAGTKYYTANAAGGIANAPGTVAQMVGIGIATDLIYMRIPLQ